ncbi:MAG: hypothetical protein K8T20_11705 [Planctomycetes bacterium]|nr:hypothetical protein [Planctomycetota bacterium]
MKSAHAAALVLLLSASQLFAAPPDWTSPGTRDMATKVGKVRRTLRLHVPEGRGEEALPLVIVLHGFLMTGVRMEEVSGFTAVADAEKFVVAYPNGVSMKWRNGLSEKDVDDVAFIGRVMDKLVGAGTVDARRIYVCGFSNGAFMSNRLACDLGDRIAAIGLVAGTLDPDMEKNLKPGRPMPVIYFHGDADKVVAFGGAGGLGGGFTSAEATAAWWAEKNGCAKECVTRKLKDKAEDGTTVERRVWKAAEKGAEVRLYVVKGGGHTWPGGGPVAPGFEGLVGATSKDVNATDLMWKFFKRHTSPEPGQK